MFIDILLAVVLAYGIYIGYSNGIIKTVFTVLSIAIGFLITAHFHETVTDLLKSVTGYNNPMMMFAGMIVTFLVTMLFLRLIGTQIENIFKAANINFINQILGGIVMSTLFIVIYSLIINFMVQAQLLKEQTADSKSYPILIQVPEYAQSAWSSVSPKVKELWHDMAIALDEMSENTEDINIDDFGGKEREIRDLSDDEDSDR